MPIPLLTSVYEAMRFCDHNTLKHQRLRDYVRKAERALERIKVALASPVEKTLISGSWIDILEKAGEFLEAAVKTATERQVAWHWNEVPSSVREAFESAAFTGVNIRELRGAERLSILDSVQHEASRGVSAMSSVPSNFGPKSGTKSLPVTRISTNGGVRKPSPGCSAHISIARPRLIKSKGNEDDGGQNSSFVVMQQTDMMTVSEEPSHNGAGKTSTSEEDMDLWEFLAAWSGDIGSEVDGGNP